MVHKISISKKDLPLFLVNTQLYKTIFSKNIDQDDSDQSDNDEEENITTKNDNIIIDIPKKSY